MKGKAPALAAAIIQVRRSHEHRDMTGIPFSPQVDVQMLDTQALHDNKNRDQAFGPSG